MTPLFFLLYYYPPLVNQVARNAPGASFGQGQIFLCGELLLPHSAFINLDFHLSDFKKYQSNSVPQNNEAEKNFYLTSMSQNHEKQHVEMNGSFFILNKL